MDPELSGYLRFLILSSAMNFLFAGGYLLCLLGHVHTVAHLSGCARNLSELD